MAIKETYDDKDLLNKDFKFSPLDEDKYKFNYYSATPGAHMLVADVRNMIRASEHRVAL